MLNPNKLAAKKGFSLVASIISIGIIVLLVSAISQTFFTKSTAQRKVIEFGHKADLRRWVQESISCSQTLAKETDRCDAGLSIHGHQEDGSRLIFNKTCLLYTSPSPRDQRGSRMPSSA